MSLSLTPRVTPLSRSCTLLACLLLPHLSHAAAPQEGCLGPVDCSRRQEGLPHQQHAAKPYTSFAAEPSAQQTPSTALDIRPGLAAELRNSTFTVARLAAKAVQDNFSYVPVDGLFGINRTLSGFLALGDLSLRVRAARPQQCTLPPPADLEPYPAYLTLTTASANPDVPLASLPHAPWELFSHDITPQLGLPKEFPLKLSRTYAQAWDEAGGLLLSFTLRNTDPFNDLEVGALSFPLIFQGRWDGMTLAEMARSAAFVETALCGHQGWASVTRMTGRDAVLLVLPENGTALEAWRPAREDPGNANTLWSPHWMVHSKAYREAEWREAAEPWNPPTSLVLGPNQSHTVGLRLLLAPRLQALDATLQSAGRATVHAVPGFVLGTDMETAQLLVTPPRGSPGIASAVAEPPQTLSIGPPRALGNGTWSIPLRGLLPGRVRLVLTYANSNGSPAGGQHSVHYHVLPPFRDHVAAFGSFLAEKAWWGPEAQDPFGRSSSVMPWDREAQQHVTQDPRLFVVGLSDEAGAGANVALAAMAQHAPTRALARRLAAYIHETLWGVKRDLPFPVSLQDQETGGVAASLFYVPGEGEPGMPNFTYAPSTLAGWGWNRDRAVKSFGRAYNYPHQVSAYWAMYRLLRNHDLVDAPQPALWYLKQAAFTIKAAWQEARWYTQFGLMVGTVFREVLRDLQREGLTDDATAVEGIMRARMLQGVQVNTSGPCPEPPGGCACSADPAQGLTRLDCPPWADNPFPFGSEFAWDSTGQEEIHAWSRWFGKEGVAAAVRDAVLAFTPNLPHWGYQGSALGTGDFSNNARDTPYGGWERVLLHYRAGLNAIPLLEAFRSDPQQENLGLLERGLGAVAGQLTNLDGAGQPSMGLHADPASLRHDPYSGDYGIGFFGHALNSASYALFGAHSGAGWLCYLCDLRASPQGDPQGDLRALATPVLILPRDSLHKRVFVGPLGLYLSAEAGTLQSVLVSMQQQLLNVTFEPLEGGLTSRVRLHVEAPSAPHNSSSAAAEDGGGFCVTSHAAVGVGTPAGASQSPGAGAAEAGGVSNSSVAGSHCLGLAEDVIGGGLLGRGAVDSASGGVLRQADAEAQGGRAQGQGLLEFAPADRTAPFWLVLELRTRGLVQTMS